MRRHDFVTLSPEGWRRLLDTHPSVAEDSLACRWGERGWPLVVRRFMPGESVDCVPLGLPLPPDAGKRRLPVRARAEDVASRSRPPLLDAAVGAAPPRWRPTLERVTAWAARQGMEARVFGSLAWAHVTGLAYVVANSDVDLLLPLPAGADIERLYAGLEELQASAPMRLDGEFVRADAAAVSWKELRSGNAQVLLKSLDAVELVSAADFTRGALPP